LLKELVIGLVYIAVEQSRIAAASEDLIPTRATLLTRLKNWDDKSSWEEFFNTYWRLIYSVARKSGLSDADAQDIVQETVISVARNIEGFKYDPAKCSFKTWMLQLTRWRISNQLKKLQRDAMTQAPTPAPSGLDDAPTASTLEAVPDPVGCGLEVIWEQEWKNSLFAAALERVKAQVAPEQFQMFDLCCLEQWPAQKVARTLGVNVARVYLAKHRISRLLRQKVKLLEQGDFGKIA
jgi:RNA polymerase sigma factor (sigma-70 family)